LARPQKKTVDYFPHYVTGSKKTLFILESKYGIQGYYFWFRLLELLATTEGHCYDLSNTANAEYLLSYTKTDPEIADNILNTLSSLDAIDKELWEEGRIIWSQNFVDGIADAYKKRVDQIPQKPSLSRRKPVGDDISGAGNPPETVNPAPETGKRKESKVKESKVKESIDLFVPEIIPDEKTPKFKPEHMELAERLRDRILKNKPDAKVPTSLNQWADTIRLMIERDNRSLIRIAEVIDWCQQDEFWRGNILSAGKLREQFDQLEIKMAEKTKRGQPRAAPKWSNPNPDKFKGLIEN